jgi:hypothetical protein
MKRLFIAIALFLLLGLSAWSQEIDADTSYVPEYEETADTAETVSDTVVVRKVVKRSFVHREQLLQGTWMMIFVIFIIVSSKNWNPN